jgi:hypothetical protein
MEPTGLAQDPAQKVPELSVGHGNEDQVGSTLYQESPSSSVSSFDVALDDFFTEDDDTNHEVCQKTDSTVSVVATDKKCCTAGRIPGVVQFHTIYQENKCKLYCTLIGVGIICDPLYSGPSLPPTEVNISAATKILGNLIHTVFSQGKQPLSSIIYQNPMTPEVDDAGIASDAYLLRHSKLRRNKDESLFSCLVESGHYPISICRFVSDMVDVGPNGKADAPFASFDEVIHDLELPNH